MKPASMIGLLNHIGGGNLGDDATLAVVMDHIKRRWPHAVITAFSINPNDSQKRHGIPSYPIRATTWTFGYTPARTEATVKERVKTLARKHTLLFRVLRATHALAVRLPRGLFRELSFMATSFRIIRSFDLLIISGGGQLTEWGGPWGFPYTIFKWVLLAKSTGVRCFFLNVGAGPLFHPLSRFFVTRALRAAHYVSFRDDQSRTLLREIGFSGESRVFPDSAYALEAPAPNLNFSSRRGRSVVGFSPMPYCDPRVYPAEQDQVIYDDFIRKLALFASWLVKRSYSLALFGNDIGVDPLAIVDLQTALRKLEDTATSQYVRYDSIHSIGELLSQMSAMDYIVTCRFHGVIFAHLLNKPVLAISHHPKVANLMKDLGLSRYCVDIRAFDLDLLTDTFASLVSNADEIRSCMTSSLARYKQELTIQFDDLFSHGSVLAS